MSYATASGALKYLRRISDKIPIDRVFDFFQPESTEIVHLDEIVSREGVKKIYRWFARGSHNNKVVYAWGLSQVRNFLTANAIIINATIKHNHKDPKVWVSDGLIEYHTSLLAHYGKKRIQTVFLGKIMGNGTAWMTRMDKIQTFSISKDNDFLVISQGLPESKKIHRKSDCRHYTTTIETVLSLFRDSNACCVYIEALLLNGIERSYYV